MKTIYRYVVPIGDPVKIWLGGDPLAVAVSGEYGQPSFGIEFWAETDHPEVMGTRKGRTRERTFTVVGTGHPIPDTAKHWGTAARTRDGMIWHLYELDPRRYRSGNAGDVKININP